MRYSLIVKKQDTLRSRKNELTDSMEDIKNQLELAKLKDARCEQELDLEWYQSAKHALRFMRRDLREVERELCLLNQQKIVAADSSFTSVARELLDEETFQKLKMETSRRPTGDEIDEEEVYSHSALSA